MAEPSHSHPVYVTPGLEEALWFFGMLVLIKASGEQTRGLYSLTEQQGRRGAATPLHLQTHDAEMFLVLDGELKLYLEDEEPIDASAGATAFIPAGSPHAFRVVSETARWLNLTTPNHEAFFRAAGQPAAERKLPPNKPPDMPVIMEAAARFGVEILGPPPTHDAEAFDQD